MVLDKNTRYGCLMIILLFLSLFCWSHGLFLKFEKKTDINNSFLFNYQHIRCITVCVLDNYCFKISNSFR